MEEHDGAAMVCSLPKEQPETSGAGAGCWGTCEELLLVSAVKRHGVSNWNLISSELKARAISLNVSPLYFSEAACKQKYDILRGRYASSSSSSRSRNEEMGNDMHWFEELRKLRVAHLKRELEHYDGSIGSLQVKIRKLKAEKARDTSVSKQLRKSIANSQPLDEVRGDSSCEVAIQSSSGKESEVDHRELTGAQSSPNHQQVHIALGSERNQQGSVSSQAPSCLQQQVLPEGDQWHDAVEELPDAPPALKGSKISASAPNNVHSPDSIKGNGVEQECLGSGALLSSAETRLSGSLDVSGNLLEDYNNAGADRLGIALKNSGVQELRPELEVADTQRDHQSVDESSADALGKHEAVDIVLDASDNGEIKSRKVVADESVQGRSGQEGLDKTLADRADADSILESCKDGGLLSGVTEQDSVVVCTPPPTQQSVAPTDVGAAEGRQPEVTLVREENVKSSKEEEDIASQTKQTLPDANTSLTSGLHLEVDDRDQEHVVLPHEPIIYEPATHLGSTTLKRTGDIVDSVQPTGETVTPTPVVPHVSEVPQDVSQGMLSGISDDVISLEGKQGSTKGLDANVNDNDFILDVVNDSAAVTTKSAETSHQFDSALTESVSMSQGSEKLGVSAVVPVASFVYSESSFPGQGSIVTSEKSDAQGSANRSSRLLYIEDVYHKSPSPERHIVIALDRPHTDILSSRCSSVVPLDTEGEGVCQKDTQTGSGVVSDIQATGKEEEQHILAQSSENVVSEEPKGGATALAAPGNAMDLLMEVYGTGHENGSDAVSQATKVVQDSEVEVAAPASLNSLKSHPDSDEGGATVIVQVDHDPPIAEETAGVSDEQPSTSEMDFETGLGQISRDFAVTHDLDVMEDVVSGSDKINASEDRLEAGAGAGAGEAHDGCDKLALKISLVQDLALLKSASDGDEGEGRHSTNSCKELEESSVPTLTSEPTNPALTMKTHQDVGDIQDPPHDGESKLPEIIVDISKDELSGVDSEAEPSSPVESLAGGLDSKMPSSHEGSDSVQEQYKHGAEQHGDGQVQNNRDYLDSDVDKSEAGSPLDGTEEMSPSSRRNRKEPRVSGKLFPLLEVLRNISNHKSAYLFKGKHEDPRYGLVIRRHLDLPSVRARLEEGAYTGSSEFFRDLLLIFNNAMVYYPRDSVEFQGAQALLADSTKEMHRIFQTEALLKQDGPATRTREVNKPKVVVGVAPPVKVVAPCLVSGGSGAKLVSANPLSTSLPDNGSRKRASSRLGAVETSTNSDTVVHSEGGAARSASVNILGGPSTSRAEEAEDVQENDQEVNGRLKDRKKLQKGSGSNRGKPPREELLEGILLKNASNKGLGRPKLRDVKEEEPARKPALPAKPVGGGKTRAELELGRKREAEKDKVRGKEVRGKERDDIDDDDFLRKGKSLAKLRDQEVAPVKGPEVKPAPKSRAATAARVASNSHDSIAQSAGRPSRGGRKPVSTGKEAVRPSEQQARKRMRK